MFRIGNGNLEPAVSRIWDLSFNHPRFYHSRCIFISKLQTKNRSVVCFPRILKKIVFQNVIFEVSINFFENSNHLNWTIPNKSTRNSFCMLCEMLFSENFNSRLSWILNWPRFKIYCQVVVTVMKLAKNVILKRHLEETENNHSLKNLKKAIKFKIKLTHKKPKNPNPN